MEQLHLTPPDFCWAVYICQQSKAALEAVMARNGQVDVLLASAQSAHTLSHALMRALAACSQSCYTL